MTAPEHVPGQMTLSGEERAELERELAENRAAQARLAAAMQEHTLRAVDRIVHTARAHSTTAAELDAAVRDARSMGATWEQIGRAAGMSRQAAWKRWASPTEEEAP